MTKAKTTKETVEIVLFNGRPRESGNIIPQETVESIAREISTGKELALQELDPIGRKVAGKSEVEVWKERIMADAVSCRLEGEVLFVTFAIRTNRYGKRFQAALNTHGVRGLYFYPVGYGVADKNGVIPDYHLCYVAFEPRNAMKIDSNGQK